MTRAEIDEALGQAQIEAVILLDRINRLRAERRPAKHKAQIEECAARVAALDLYTARLLDLELAHSTEEATGGDARAAVAMKRAMRRARSEGTAPVAGAERVGKAMMRTSAALLTHGDARTWELTAEDGSTYRLTLAPSRSTGVMRWIKRSEL